MPYATDFNSHSSRVIVLYFKKAIHTEMFEAPFTSDYIPNAWAEIRDHNTCVPISAISWLHERQI